ACGNDKLFGLLVDVMKMPELLSDPRFECNNQRVLNHDALKTIVDDWTKDKTIDDIVDTLLAVGIPAGPINTIDRVVKDPHIADAREMFVEIEHPTAGKMKITGNQIKFTNRKIEIKTPSPLLGQHNDEVYGDELGLSHEEVQKLKENKVI
ncbi:MAG: CoA transferase, partial [Oscillospiraceae bacterium]